MHAVLVKPNLTPDPLSNPCRWVKLKPDYGDMTEEFDLVLVAGQHGEGQYKGWVGTLS